MLETVVDVGKESGSARFHRLLLGPEALLLVCIVLDFAVFGADVLLPAAYSFTILYVGVILLAFWLPWRPAILGLALLGTVLIVSGFALSSGSGVSRLPETVVNRSLAIFVIWWATALALAQRNSRDALARSRSLSSANEARLQSILETAPEAFITIDDAGRIESFSRSSELLFGYAAHEVIGKNVSILMPSPYREEHDGYVSRYLRTRERRIIGIGRVVSARRRDGSAFPIELAVGEAKADGKRLFTGFIRDMSARQRLEQELRQAQKMEAVGQLTGGIAHDFNNLLTVILGNLEMVEAKLTDARQTELVREARETAEHGAKLTERLLAFGRRQPLQPKYSDLRRLIEGTQAILARTLGEAIEVTTRLDEDLCEVLVDQSQFQSTLLNLAINARDAMPGGGHLVISAANTEIDLDYARLHSEVSAGRYVVVSVTDTGAGMSREVQERAFEPFFTTKEVGAGSGLGLSMVYGFVKQSKGHVEIYSEESRGTTIRIYLPQADQAERFADRRDLNPLAEFRADGETVLVVEDEARVRRLTIGRLKELGYRVLEAGSGPNALEILGSSDVDLVFTDVVMPGGMTGADLARQIRRDRPGMKVLFTSGYAEPELLEKGLLRDARWLRKPYSIAELARTLREILDGPVA